MSGGKTTKPKKRWLWRIAVLAVVALLCATGLAMYLLQRPPAVWDEAQQILADTTPQQRAEIAQDVMHRLSALAEIEPTTDGHAQESLALPDATNADAGNTTAADPQAQQPPPEALHIDRTGELRLTNQELVAMVSDTFDQWAVQRGYEVPSAFTQPVVMVEGGDLMIAFAVTIDSWHQVFSGNLELTFHPDGMAHGRVTDLTAGSLPVSVQRIGQMIRRQLPESEAHRADQIGDWLSELEGFEFRPVLELEHRRRARVLAMDLSDNAMTVRMRVQDHETYRLHNGLMDVGEVAVTDTLERHVVPAAPEAAAPGPAWFADVPTTTD